MAELKTDHHRALLVWVNGSDRHSISPHDRGLAYGDGVFETLAIFGGLAVDLELHLARLRSGLGRLGIAFFSYEQLAREAEYLASRHDRAVLKIIVTRGSGGRGYAAQAAIEPTRILSVHLFPEFPLAHYQEGVAATVCRYRLCRNPVLAGVKHLNRLDNVMARQEWGDEFQEGLMLDTGDKVIEGVMSNVFMLRGKQLITPKLNQAGVAGITRQKILDIAPDFGLIPQVATLRLTDFDSADALFFCNSLIGLWPVRSLAERAYSISPIVQALARKVAPHISPAD